MTRLRLFVVIALALLVIAPGCRCSKRDDGTMPVAEVETLPPLVVRDDTPDLLLTWIDDHGDTHSATTPAEIPIGGKSYVRVVSADRVAGTGNTFYVADYSRKLDDGTYPVKSVARRVWDAEIERRRAEYVAELEQRMKPRGTTELPPQAPPPADKIPKAELGDLRVIIYGASWCGPCHQAADYLKSRGVDYVLKDIETSEAAASEMREKLRRVGEPGGSIPVIDVKGQILIGYSRSALDRALAKVARGTVL